MVVDAAAERVNLQSPPKPPMTKWSAQSLPSSRQDQIFANTGPDAGQVGIASSPRRSRNINPRAAHGNLGKARVLR